MQILTSGRIVDISTDRAKYHALKHNGPLPESEYKALYHLVDIVYRLRDNEGMPKRGWTEYDYIFSGYTLADIYKIKDWSHDEKSDFYQWINQDTQKLLIKTALRRLVHNQQQLSVKKYSAPNNLYSSLQSKLQALTLQKASAEQWLSTINNMHQTGLHQEEIIWSGLYKFLSKQSAKTIFNKQQIINNINFKNIRLELSVEQIWGTNGGLSFKEVAQQMPHQAVFRAVLKLDDSCHCILRYLDQTCNYRVGMVKTLTYDHKMALNKFWFALDPYGRAIANSENKSLFYDNSNTAIKAADQHARDEFGLSSGAKSHSHYSHLTLFGGHDYKEWLLSLPDYQRVFFGAHHFDHNVLLHLRTTTRHDLHNHKLLFIEEVQSDWHQTGSRNGYNTSYWGTTANAPFKKEWLNLAMKLMLIHASQNGFDGIAWPKGNIQEARYSGQLQAIKRRYDIEMPKTLNHLGKTFNCNVTQTTIKTRDPWLNLVKSKNRWHVADSKGKFKTRNKYHSREQAMMVLHRHCKTINLPILAFLLSTPLKQQIANKGLPLFGKTFL
jgi:hypothetical protein